MPTLTRLALGASAVSALTVFGTALPAAASTPTRTVPHAPATTHSAKTATAKPTTAKPTTSRAAADRRVARTTGRSAAATKASRAEAAREARGARRSVVLHAITAERRAAARAAATHSTATHSTGTRPTARPARRTPTRVSGGRTSANWSGYTQSAQDVGRPVSSVSASWQIPRVRQHVSGQSEAASDWVGIGGTRSRGAADPTLIQAGTTSTVGRAGIANHYAWVETLPSSAVETPLTTRSGDHISVAIGRVTTDLWRIRMANATTGRSWSTSVRYHSSQGSADFVSERPRTSAGSTELPDRTPTTFRKATVNGTSAHFRPSQRVTMTDNGRAISTPSAPEGQGDGFSVTSAH